MRETVLSQRNNKLFYISISNFTYTNMVYSCCRFGKDYENR